MKKINVRIVDTNYEAAAVNLFEEAKDIEVAKEVMVNYTYTNIERHMMILYIRAPLSLAGVSWMTQYLEEFRLRIEDMKSITCNQPFVFGPSKRYVSKILVELPILVTRLDGKEDVLTVQTYLVDAEVPFLCGKQTLEFWNFKIDRSEKILEI